MAGSRWYSVVVVDGDEGDGNDDDHGMRSYLVDSGWFAGLWVFHSSRNILHNGFACAACLEVWNAVLNHESSLPMDLLWWRMMMTVTMMIIERILSQRKEAVTIECTDVNWH